MVTAATPVRILPAGLVREVVRRAPGARSWLEELPDLWGELARAWHLSACGPLRHGGTSLVVPVLAAGRPAALKLCSPLASATQEARALVAFGGRGAVRLHAVDEERQALLLQWLPGPALTAEARPPVAVSTAGGIARTLADAVPPPDAPSLSGRAGAWRTQLLEQHERAASLGTALPAALLELALEGDEAVARDTTPALTHGDLASQNVLRSESGQWVAIDVSLVTGTAAHEAHTAVRSHLPALLRRASPARAEAELTRRFAAAAGVDAGLARSVSFARWASSAYWESQNGGSAAGVERLQRMCLAVGADLLAGTGG